MERKGYNYKLTLEGVTTPTGEPMEKDPIEVNFTNHDDLYRIIEMSLSKNIFSTKEESLQFTIGLKMFTEIMMSNKNNPIFEELYPAMGAFMKKLKSR